MLKIGGRQVSGPKKGLVVLPRREGDIPFHFTAVLDDSDFEKICPPPKPPVSIKTGVGRVENVEDPVFQSRLKDREITRRHWMFLKSVSPSNIEWQKVKMDKPETYAFWESELLEAGFSTNERQVIYLEFLTTNLLTDTMLDEARGRFLASRSAQGQADLSSLKEELKITQAGEPVNDLASAPLG